MDYQGERDLTSTLLHFIHNWKYLSQDGVPKVKPHINLVGVHPHLSDNRLPIDRVVVAVVGSRWPKHDVVSP